MSRNELFVADIQGEKFSVADLAKHQNVHFLTKLRTEISRDRYDSGQNFHGTEMSQPISP